MTTTQPSYLHQLSTVQPPRSTHSSFRVTFSSTQITNNWSFLLMCFTLSAEPARCFTSSTSYQSLYLWSTLLFLCKQTNKQRLYQAIDKPQWQHTMKQSVTQDSTEREYIQCLYSAISGHTQSVQTWITQFYLQITPCLPFLFRKRSPDGATRKWGGRHLMGTC